MWHHNAYSKYVLCNLHLPSEHLIVCTRNFYFLRLYLVVTMMSCWWDSLYLNFTIRAKFQHFCESLYVYSEPHRDFIFHWFGLKFNLNTQETLRKLGNIFSFKQLHRFTEYWKCTSYSLQWLSLSCFVCLDIILIINNIIKYIISQFNLLLLTLTNQQFSQNLKKQNKTNKQKNNFYMGCFVTAGFCF